MSFYLDFRWPQAGRRIFAIAGIFVIIAAVPDRASAQSADVGVLLDRIERLERDIRTLNVQIAWRRCSRESAGLCAPQSTCFADGGRSSERHRRR